MIRLLSPHVDVPPLCIILRYLQLGLPVATRSMCRPHIFLLRTRRKRKTVHIVLWILINEQSSWTVHCCYSRTKHATPQTYGWMKKSETKIENPSTKASSKQSRTQSRRSKKLFRPLSTKRKTGESLAILLRDKLQGTVLIM